jgi:hypothetical protein
MTTSQSAPHLAFGDYAPDDTTAMPCACWMAGRKGQAMDPQALHPEEWQDGAETAYAHANDI